MLEERHRILRMFYALTQAKSTIRSKELATYAGISERTVKNDIEDLRACAKRSGAELKSE